MLDLQTERLIDELADDIAVPRPALKAVIAVESAGESHINGLVPIRWEGHYFWRFLSEENRIRARNQGLASPRSQAVKNPRSMPDRYRLLERAKLIDAEAAMKSISIGMGQIMGAHAKRLGFSNVFEMWEENQTVRGQLKSIALYVEKFGLADELRNQNWKGFARAYNGPSYAINRYDAKLREAFNRYSEGEPVLYAVQDDGDLRIGYDSPQRVRNLQGRLSEIGYPVRPDGDFGPETKRQVQNFQLDHGLYADGVVGPDTQRALDTTEVREISLARAQTTAKDLKKRSRIARDGSSVQKAGAGVVAVAGGYKAVEETNILDKVSDLGGKAEQAVNAFAPFRLLLEFAADNLWAVMAGGGIALGFWGSRIVKSRLEDHRTEKTI